jgi:hypothetical protein
MTVTQTFASFDATNAHSILQREKLFKNAVSWLLRLATPPPYMNLSVSIEAQPDAGIVGESVAFTVTLQHSGESEATGITVAFEVPPQTQLLSVLAPEGEWSEEDGVVLGKFDALAHAEAKTLQLLLRPMAAGSIVARANVSSNSPEAVIGDNTREAAMAVARGP